MDDRIKKEIYEWIAGALSLAVFIALFAAVYSHLWLDEFSETPMSDLALFFSESAQEEKARMEDIRLFGAVGTVMGLSLLAAISPAYEKFLEKPRWEAKKGLAFGVVMVIGGGFLYISTSSLVREAISYSAIALGLLLTVYYSYYLATNSPE